MTSISFAFSSVWKVSSALMTHLKRPFVSKEIFLRNTLCSSDLFTCVPIYKRKTTQFYSSHLFFSGTGAENSHVYTVVYTLQFFAFCIHTNCTTSSYYKLSSVNIRFAATLANFLLNIFYFPSSLSTHPHESFRRIHGRAPLSIHAHCTIQGKYSKQ